MNHFKAYEAVISKALSEGRVRNGERYYEKHHIVPKCLGGDNSNSNLVLLTGKEHFLAHKLLRKMYPESKSLFFALLQMAIDPKDRGFKLSASEYETLRKEFSKRQTGENNPAKSESVRAKMSLAKKGKPSTFLGKTFSEETKARMAIERKGRYAGSKNPMFGVRPWNTGTAAGRTEGIWSKADLAYSMYLQGYGHVRMYRDIQVQGSNRSSFISMVRKFRSGWVPLDDVEWVSSFKVDRKT